MKIPAIKICGLTDVSEAAVINEEKVEYAGLVMFFEKSRRNNSLENAMKILKALDQEVKKVAVTVSPDIGQLKMIEEAGFDIIQIHGELSEEVAAESRLPIFRAYNISEEMKKEASENQEISSKITGWVLDGKVPGNGKTFDWGLMKEFDRKGRLLVLAGGLNAGNVTEGIKTLAPDVVDVSSGVEGENGKDTEKIREFVRKVRSYE
ncbi:phosphoribosylanthranilate isomerase [Anaerobium acetethylicum]|uniref:N-(5'-phosphoribosyl)anthranilate isomerase n=1 Tax=Anaerobium acetethylicum TaxID=1619234 RepID=A0A1D3TS71_9FIRM|nr:phosphoribosylanthranilate isomerase [Anaerobium acetethylicum]SCP96639.1 phosphoribosylanthranilate isomerase [Anaerobium acetethylicum]